MFCKLVKKNFSTTSPAKGKLFVINLARCKTYPDLY